MKTITDNAVFLETLGQYHLLEGEQLTVAARLQSEFPDPRKFAAALMMRDWLSPYQLNQIFRGRGADLLLGSYVLLERLGEGGMGAVFKARNWKLGTIFAVKVIRQERLVNEAAIRRFQREIRAAAQLEHPNIVKAIDADCSGNTHFLVMEYVEGIDLAKLVKKVGPLPIDDACEYIRQAALGLQHAFERGLVHRDIKPANLLLVGPGGWGSDHGPGDPAAPTPEDGLPTPEGGLPKLQLKILDMGLARIVYASDEESSILTQEGLVIGTPDFIAPEQARDSHRVDIRADLYSLGCVFYFLLAKRTPFPGGSMLEKLLRHQQQQPMPLQQVRPVVPDDVAGIVRKLMAKNPDQRYQTPADLIAALDQSKDARLDSGRASTVDLNLKDDSVPVARLADDPFADLVEQTAIVKQKSFLLRKAAQRNPLAFGILVGIVLLLLVLLLFSIF